MKNFMKGSVNSNEVLEVNQSCGCLRSSASRAGVNKALIVDGCGDGSKREIAHYY
jgi:hypothetical protein